MLQLDILLLIVNAAATWFMGGVIWFVQIVHYPLFDGMGASDFQNYAVRHRNLTSMVVVIPMLTEIVTSLVLAMIWKRPDGLLLWLAFWMVVGIWICTALGSIPCHERLCSSGYSTSAHHLLVSSNWLRTLLWSARAVLVSFLMYKLAVSSTTST